MIWHWFPLIFYVREWSMHDVIVTAIGQSACTSSIASSKSHAGSQRPVSTLGPLGPGWEEIIGEKKRKAPKKKVKSSALYFPIPAHGRFQIVQVCPAQSVSWTSTANGIYYIRYIPPGFHDLNEIRPGLVTRPPLCRFLSYFRLSFPPSLWVSALQGSPRNCHLIFNRRGTMTHTG